MGSLKPGNFFLGLLDFLGIFVPGAVLLFILLDVHLVRELIDNEFHFADASLEEGQPDSKPTQTTSTQFRSAAAFFFGAYFLGHFVYLIGSLFLDRLHEYWLKTERPVFYLFSRRCDKTTANRCKRYGGLLGRQRESTIRQRKILGMYIAEKLAKHFKRLDGLGNAVPQFDYASDAVWRLANCIASGGNESAAAYLERTRSESRFFRSMTIVLLFGGIIFAVKALYGTSSEEYGTSSEDSNWLTHFWASVISFVFCGFSWIRFAERRVKHEAETYNYFLATVAGPWNEGFPETRGTGGPLSAGHTQGQSEADPNATEGPLQAGVHRRDQDLASEPNVAMRAATDVTNST